MMVTRDILAPKLLPEEGKKKKKEKIQRRASSPEKTHACARARAERRRALALKQRKHLEEVTPHLSSVRTSGTVEAPAAPLGCTLTGLFFSLLLQARIEELEEELEAERAMRAKVGFAAAAKHLPVSKLREVELRAETAREGEGGRERRGGEMEGRMEGGLPVWRQPPMGVLCVDAAAASGHPKPAAPVIIKQAGRGPSASD